MDILATVVKTSIEEKRAKIIKTPIVPKRAIMVETTSG